MRKNYLLLLTLIEFISCTNHADKKQKKVESPYATHTKEVIALAKSGDTLFKINDTIKSLVKFIVNPKNKNKFLIQRFYSNDLCGVKIFSVINGRNYTIFYSGDSLPNKNYYLTFWVRPTGTHNRESLSRFTDNGLDGNIDYARKGEIWDMPGYKKEFSNGKFYDSIPWSHKYKKYWQKRYENAVKDFFNFYKIKYP